MIIDRKFRILAVNPCKQNRIYTEKEGIFFCAKDKAVPAMLKAYQTECSLLGSNAEHMESIESLIERVREYQLTVESHIPDTDTDCEIDRCIGGLNLEDE